MASWSSSHSIIHLCPNGDRMLAMGIGSPPSSKSRSMVYRREIVAHGGILALRDESHGRQKTQTGGPSTMITSREIRLKSRPVGMPNADNFELATVSVPHPAPGEVQVGESLDDSGSLYA
jgi:hypothetical protein